MQQVRITQCLWPADSGEGVPVARQGQTASVVEPTPAAVAAAVAVTRRIRSAGMVVLEL